MTPSGSHHHKRAFDKALASFLAHTCVIAERLDKSQLLSRKRHIDLLALRVQLHSIRLLAPQMPPHSTGSRQLVLDTAVSTIQQVLNSTQKFPSFQIPKAALIDLHALAAFAQLKIRE